MTNEQLAENIAEALNGRGDVISAEVIETNTVGVETTDGRYFVTVQPID